jgi:hypothetical protein
VLTTNAAWKQLDIGAGVEVIALALVDA